MLSSSLSSQLLQMKLTAIQLEDLFQALVSVVFPGQKPFPARPPEATSRRALSGLQESINDLFTMHGGFAPFERERLDKLLKEKGLPPLHVIESRRSRRLPSILKRGRIRDSDEYYLVKGHLDDDLSELEPGTTDHLAILVRDYEATRQRPFRDT
jgi:hypothetical protein